MPTRNVELTEHDDHFIAGGIESGRFSHASEAVREGLRFLEQREADDRAKVAWLQSAAQESLDAIERGDYTVLTTPEEIDSLVDGIHRGVIAEGAVELRSA